MTQNSHRDSFSNVDHASSPRRFVEYLAVSNGSESIEERQHLRRLLRLEPGQRVLDVGCGLGHEIEALARIVGDDYAVGIDCSMTMLQEAVSRNRLRTLVAGDAHALPFSTGSFDACRVERVLQHVADPHLVIREIVRVAEAGGYVLAVEPDWATLLIDSSDIEVTSKIIDFKQRRVRNGWIGRQLRRLFLECGIKEVQLDFVAGWHSNFNLADKLIGLERTASQAVIEGCITPDECDSWLDGLRLASANGRFFVSLTRVVAAGLAP